MLVNRRAGGKVKAASSVEPPPLSRMPEETAGSGVMLTPAVADVKPSIYDQRMALRRAIAMTKMKAPTMMAGMTSAHAMPEPMPVSRSMC